MAAASAPIFATRPEALRRNNSDVMDIDDPRQRFDCGPNFGFDAKAAGNFDLDLPLGEVEHHRDATAATRLTADQTLQLCERMGLTEKHPQTRRS